MSAEAPTFGSYVRAARLGFRWYAPLSRYVRISDHPDGGWLVQACTPSRLPSHAKGHYRCWWEDDVDVVAMVPALLEMRDRSSLSIRVDDDGRLVR